MLIAILTGLMMFILCLSSATFATTFLPVDRNGLEEYYIQYLERERKLTQNWSGVVTVGALVILSACLKLDQIDVESRAGSSRIFSEDRRR